LIEKLQKIDNVCGMIKSNSYRGEDIVMKNLVFFDVDGTLVTRNNHIPKSTIQAIKQLKQNDVLPVIATGRAPVLIREIANKLKIDSYIAMNGQYIVYQGDVIYENPIDMTLVDKLVEFATEQQDGMILSTRDEIIANSVISLTDRGRLFTFLKGIVGLIPDRIQLYFWERMMKNTPAKEDYADKDIFMMNINADQEEEVAYRKKFDDHLTFTRANERSMDIINKGVSKAKGAQKLMTKLDIPKQQTYAFGDGLNDLELMQFVGTGVAMENGFEELKAASDFITTSVFDDGIANGLKKLKLI